MGIPRNANLNIELLLCELNVTLVSCASSCGHFRVVVWLVFCPGAPVAARKLRRSSSTRQHGEAMVADIAIRVHRVRDRAVWPRATGERGKRPGLKTTVERNMRNWTGTILTL